MKVDMKLPDSIFGLETGLFKIFLLPLPFILGFLLSLKLVIIPKIDEINNTNRTIATKNSQINVITAKKNYLLSVDKEVLKRDQANLKSALLDKDKTYYLTYSGSTEIKTSINESPPSNWYN